MKQSQQERPDNYARQAVYYDAIYEAQGKGYGQESEKIHDFIQRYKKSPGNELLDVGCGTGGHFPYLKNEYHVEGLDIDEHMLQVARRRHPDIAFHQGNMVDFDLRKQFDAVTCVFSPPSRNPIESDSTDEAKKIRYGGFSLHMEPDEESEGS